MSHRRQKQQCKTLFIVVVLALLGAGLIVYVIQNQSENTMGNGGAPRNVTETQAEKKHIYTGTIQRDPKISYAALETDMSLKTMMDDRKKNLGISHSLDMIVKSDETFTVGSATVSMQKILAQAFSGQEKIFEADLSESGEALPATIKEYGIYVVQPGDNIWNIHFRLLKDYYLDKGIHLEEGADEPVSREGSSGIGKILKFSEALVIIYNTKEEKISRDINLIEPLSKIVIYNMSEVFALLDEITFNNVDRLRYDGENIWIPAQTY